LVTIAYVLWALLPVLVAIQFSFNGGRSRTVWQGFSLRWYLTDAASVARDDSLRLALFQSVRLAFLTMLVATPLGVALALGLARWRGRGARPAGFLMLVPLITPEIVMGVALFMVFANLYDFVPFGTWAQFLGHVTFSISFVVIIVRGRLFAIGRDYEEAAMDLGASPAQAVRRVLLPLLAPAIFASLAIVFAISIDDFVISQFLVAGADTVTIPVRLYSGARLAPPPSLNALATLMLVITMFAISVAGLVMRRYSRREGTGGESAVRALSRLDF
jgi:spermidine/putrescine transport system permease protein